MPRRKGAESLSRERLVDAALALVDRDGLDALSMRRLGAELGVDPMAIYYHLPGKRALINALVEHVFAGFADAALVDEAVPWQERLRRWAGAYRRLALRHPHLVLAIVGDSESVSIAERVAVPELVAALERAGLARADVDAGAGLTVDYVNGFVLGEVAIPGGDEPAFQRGLDIIVAGLEQLATDRSR